MFPLPILEAAASKSSEKSFLSHLAQQETNFENATARVGQCCNVLKKENVRDDWLFLQNRKSGLVCRKEKNRDLHCTAEGKLLQRDLRVCERQL